MSWRGVVDRRQHSDERQDRARERERQCGAFRGGESAGESAVVTLDQLAEHRDAVRIAVAGTERRVRVVERERNVVDAGAFAHEVEIEDQHDVVFPEPHVVVPEVPMDQLPGHVVDERELGVGEHGRELVGDVGDAEVVGRWVAGANPRRPRVGPRERAVRRDVVGVRRHLRRRRHVDACQHIVDPAEDAHPGLESVADGHALPRHVTLHLDRPAFVGDERPAVARGDGRRERKTGGHERRPRLLDRVQPRRRGPRAVDARHPSAVRTRQQQVQVVRPTEIDRVTVRRQPVPRVQHVEKLARDLRALGKAHSGEV